MGKGMWYNGGAMDNNTIDFTAVPVTWFHKIILSPKHALIALKLSVACRMMRNGGSIPDAKEMLRREAGRDALGLSRTEAKCVLGESSEFWHWEDTKLVVDFYCPEAEQSQSASRAGSRRSKQEAPAAAVSPSAGGTSGASFDNNNNYNKLLLLLSKANKPQEETTGRKGEAPRRSHFLQSLGLPAMSIGDEIKLWNYLHKDEEKSAAEKQREEEALERIRGPRSNYFNGYDPMKAEEQDKPCEQ